MAAWIKVLRGVGPQTRLQKRIYLLLVGLVSVLTILGAFAVWFILIIMEDATLDRFVVRTMNQVVFYRDHELVSQQSLFIAKSKEALIERHGIANWPVEPGLHTFFADDDGLNVQFGDTWSDRFDRWVIDPREREFRLWYEPADGEGSPLWIVLDLEFSEFTEQESGAIAQFFVLYLMAIVVCALVSGYLIIRWAISPVQALASRVRSRTEGAQEGLNNANAYREDEVQYLENVVDDYARSLESSLEREKAFISDCSHELRTPITILNGAVALEREMGNADSERRNTVMLRIARSGMRMERLVNTFLILARSPDYQAETMESWKPRDLLEEVLEEMNTLHPDNTMKTSIGVLDTYETTYRRDSIFCICHNLINNSYSHLRDGELDVRLIPGEEGAFELHFTDQGAASVSAPKTGAGIGLSLVQRLCERENWKLEKMDAPIGTHYRLFVS